MLAVLRARHVMWFVWLAGAGVYVLVVGVRSAIDGFRKAAGKPVVSREARFLPLWLFFLFQVVWGLVFAAILGFPEFTSVVIPMLVAVPLLTWRIVREVRSPTGLEVFNIDVETVRKCIVAGLERDGMTCEQRAGVFHVPELKGEMDIEPVRGRIDLVRVAFRTRRTPRLAGLVAHYLRSVPRSAQLRPSLCRGASDLALAAFFALGGLVGAVLIIRILW